MICKFCHKKADIPLFSNVSDTTKVITLSLPSFSIRCQGTSMVSLSPSHCTCKESNVASESSPHKALSARSDTNSTNSCLSDSSLAEGDNCMYVALSSALLG